MSMQDVVAEPPGVLADIARAAGLEVAERIADTFGGRRVYLRSQALVPLLGDEAARLVIQSVGAGLIEVPRWAARAAAERRRAIRAALATGEPVPDIARRLGVTERAIRKAAQQDRRNAPPPQPARDAMSTEATKTEQPPQEAAAHRFVRVKGPHHGLPRNSVPYPEFEDFAELLCELNEVRGGQGLRQERIDMAREDWERQDPIERNRAWVGAQINLIDARANRARR